MTEHSRAWIEDELVNVDLEVQQYLDTYHVSTPAELEQAIQQHVVEEHPAWEDLIGWENMEDYRAKLVAELETLKAREGGEASTPGTPETNEAGTPD